MHRPSAAVNYLCFPEGRESASRPSLLRHWDLHEHDAPRAGGLVAAVRRRDAKPLRFTVGGAAQISRRKGTLGSGGASHMRRGSV